MDKPIEGDVKINENKWLWILIGECYAGKREAAAMQKRLYPTRVSQGAVYLPSSSKILSNPFKQNSVPE